ncbi:MAG: cytochrome-c peroxidase [Crocinitomicaceae bacterium]|nr:cytochrome-c peroxidase [Crocinitomicaceae bacterium]
MLKYGSVFLLFLGLSSVLCCKSYIIEREMSAQDIEEIDSTLYYKIELGKQLFYDPILSRDSSISCATCHKQELAFTDGITKAKGIFDRIGKRNSPTLTNVGNRPYLLLDGVNPSLEAQVGAPIQEHSEFDFHILLILERLKQISKYQELAKKGYDSEITEFVFVNSIAEFERTLVSNNSPYDQYLQGNKKALSESQIRGKKLFFDKFYCGKCHNGDDLTNDRLTNNGLYLEYEDDGRMRLTEREEDRAVFKVPTLRNIAITAPYMHDGSIETLEEVLQHYMTGGMNHPQKAEEIKPFELSAKEKTDLIQFFHALTDSTFITNPAYSIK